MNRPLSPQEKQLIEREFVARQEAAAKRRSFARKVFLVGILAGVVAAALRAFRVGALLPV